MKRSSRQAAAILGAWGILTGAGAAGAEPVPAAENCAPRATVVARLAEQFGEVRQAIGLGPNDAALVEVFASPASGTWTITLTTPGGITCLVASGRAFETLAEALPATGSDT